MAGHRSWVHVRCDDSLQADGTASMMRAGQATGPGFDNQTNWPDSFEMATPAPHGGEDSVPVQVGPRLEIVMAMSTGSPVT